MALYLSVLWVSVLAILQFIGGKNLGGIWYLVGERQLSLVSPYISKIYLENIGYVLRPYATFPHPNALAGYLMISLIILFKNVKIWNFKIGYWKLFGYCNLFIGISALLVTFSKTIFFPFALISHPTDLQTSLNERLTLYKNSISIFQLYPFTGIGLGSYPAVTYKLYPNSLPLSYQPVHNIFMLLLVELGLPLFIIFLYFCIKKIINLLVTGHWSLVTAWLITAMADHYWLTSPSNLLLLFVITALLQSSHAKSYNHLH